MGNGQVYDRTSFETGQRALIERTYTRSPSFAVLAIGSCIVILIAAFCGQALASAEADAPLADAAMRGDVEAVRSLLVQIGNGEEFDLNAAIKLYL